ncbi:alpha/beta fold hydrolase [Ramlibacter sp. PS4R-6]|uniref:alpha/beta fold hydrolase n=1 Tax=Ramlibacter sp. PS4R-6 TaxID=3133438 RepID=UPI00309BE274
MSAVQLRNVRLATGVTLQVAERGRGTPVLFLHGLTDSLHSWDPVLPLLPDGVHAFALSQRGHGRSDKPEAGYDSADFARDAAEFIREMGLGPMWIVGHSMGTANALRLAVDAPGLVRGLVLVGTFAGFSRNEAFEPFYREALVPLTDPVPDALAREFQLSTLASPVDADFVEHMIRQSLMVPAHVWRLASAGLLKDDIGDTRSIRKPVQLHWGDQDAFTGKADQAELLARLHGSHLVVYPAVGHAVHWEQPARFVARLVAFMRDSERTHDRTTE